MVLGGNSAGMSGEFPLFMPCAGSLWKTSVHQEMLGKRGWAESVITQKLWSSCNLKSPYKVGIKLLIRL